MANKLTVAHDWFCPRPGCVWGFQEHLCVYGPFVHPAWSTNLLVFQPGVFEAYAKNPPSVYSYLLSFYYPLGRLAEQHSKPPFSFVYTINNEFTGYTVLLRDKSEKNSRNTRIHGPHQANTTQTIPTSYSNSPSLFE